MNRTPEPLPFSPEQLPQPLGDEVLVRHGEQLWRFSNGRWKKGRIIDSLGYVYLVLDKRIALIGPISLLIGVALCASLFLSGWTDTEGATFSWKLVTGLLWLGSFGLVLAGLLRTFFELHDAIRARLALRVVVPADQSEGSERIVRPDLMSPTPQFIDLTPAAGG